MTPNNSPYRQVVKLYQHSPMLHFQWREAEACLRATDLKPRIDRFVVEELAAVAPHIFGLYEHLINKFNFPLSSKESDKVTAGYRIHIQAKVSNRYIVGSTIPRYIQEALKDRNEEAIVGAPFFAENATIKKEKWDDLEKMGLYLKDIELEVFSFNPELKDLIVKVLPYVLIYQNFGTRQSKGFGSFVVSGTPRHEFEKYLKAKYRRYFVFEGPKEASYAQLFKEIDQEYKILKSGIGKEDSQMRVYFEGKDIEWEKPLIKAELVKASYPPRNKDHTRDPRRKFIRALLGLAELYEFPQKKNSKIEIKWSGKNESDRIDRFRSPITFKIYSNFIYMLPEPIPKEVFGQTFRFTVKNQNHFYLDINTPDRPEGFDLADFLYDHVDDKWAYVEQ